MKKILILSLFALISTTSAFAGETPAARNCRVHGGQPWTLDVGQVDDLQLCILGGAQISAQSLFEAMTMGISRESIQRYIGSPMTCSEADGNARVRKDTNGVLFEVCEFADGSAIGAATLNAGKDAPENAQLSRLLGL